MIRDARFRGSLPPGVASAFRRVVASGGLRLVTANVLEASAEADGVRLMLEDVSGMPADELTADRIVLATGFGQARPGGAWLDAAVAELGLPCAPCGFPVVERSLRWAPGIYVTGPLAELEIGPVARNIIGARLASERIPRAA
jgi:pyruvate/2-oxoglutarate dehydrogenase complex dihydrolipoamide dehydrogenase (E3) component